MKASISAVATMFFAVSSMQACSSDTITSAPTSSVSRQPAIVQAVQLRLSGIVTDDEGRTVAGAKVVAYRWESNGAPVSAFTDDAGSYSISISTSMGISVMAQKDGYQSEWHSRAISNTVDFKFDLPMRRSGK